MKATLFKLGFNKLALLAAALALGLSLLIPPVVGVADNGDFARIMSAVGLAYPEPDEPYKDRYFSYAHTLYKLHRPEAPSYISSEIPIVLAAALLNRLFYSTRFFDIRFLSALYAVLLLTGLYALLQASRAAPVWTRAALASGLIVVYCDVGYTAYLNSLYGEPVALVFLLLTIGTALLLARSAERPSLFHLIAFYICAAFLAAAKVQTAPVGLVLALLAVRFRLRRGDRTWRLAWGMGTALLIIVSAGIYAVAPKEFKGINQYQTVFNGVLQGSPDPAADLRALGVDARLSVLAGTNYFTPNTPISQQDPRMNELFYSRISHAKIAMFYFSHPHRFVENLSKASQNSMMIRPYYLGNYARSAGFAPGTLSMKFSFWSEWKKKLMPHHLPFLAAFFALCTLVLLVYRKRTPDSGGRLAAETLLSVELIAAVSFVIPLIGDGLTDIGKHLFLFNACFDLLTIGAFGLTIHFLYAGVKFITAFRRGRGPIPT